MGQRETRWTISLSWPREAWPCAFLPARIRQAWRLVHNVSLMLSETSAKAGPSQQIKCFAGWALPARWFPEVCLVFHGSIVWSLWLSPLICSILSHPDEPHETNRSHMAPNLVSHTSTINLKKSIWSQYVKLGNVYFLLNVQKYRPRASPCLKQCRLLTRCFDRYCNCG